MNKQRTVIVVNNGIVEEVYTNNPEMKIVVIDLDSDEPGVQYSRKRKLRDMLKRDKSLVPAEVD